MVNEHNSLIPRDFWLTDAERQAIIDYFRLNCDEGYRRLCYMLMDAGIVAVSPTTVYRVLKDAQLLGQRQHEDNKKGTGFEQPLKAHEHWHIDISYINICGTFYYMCSILDGFSRYIVHYEIRESMKEYEVEIILQRSHEKFPDAKPRIISDNGPQFVANNFKEYVKGRSMTHVRTSPYYPQSNGKLERYHKTIKSESIRQKTPLSLEQARHVTSEFVEFYNNKRLHSAIGYITPLDMLDGRADEIKRQRDEKLATAREARKLKRQSSALTEQATSLIINQPGKTESGSAEVQPDRDSQDKAIDYRYGGRLPSVTAFSNDNLELCHA
jgi:putative transposase